MAFVLGLQRGWKLDTELSFEVKGNFERTLYPFSSSLAFFSSSFSFPPFSFPPFVFCYKTEALLELRASVNDGSTDAFMWETFMTKPYHDSGVSKRNGG